MEASPMTTYIVSVLILLAAALCEAGGDAIVRTGLHASDTTTRIWRLAAGGFVLFLYGCVVNAPPWNFGRLIGVYVVFFFVVAQAISWLVFHEPPSLTIWIGGGFIVAGGVIVSLR